MRILYNPKTATALTAAPADDNITFDLAARKIYVKGVTFDGTDHIRYLTFLKHTSGSTGGRDGLVPAPAASVSADSVLKADGSWSPITSLADTKVTQSESTTGEFRTLLLSYTKKATAPITDVSGFAATDLAYFAKGLYVQPNTGSLFANKLYSGGQQVLTSHQDLSNYVTLNTAQTISAAKTFTSGLIVSGRPIGAGDDEGIVIRKASNNYAGVTLGDPQGLRSTFYLTPTNDVLITYNDGTGGANVSIKHPKTNGTIATQEWVNNKNYLPSNANAVSATKLQTARTIWGQLFDGTANVDGVFRSLTAATNGQVLHSILKYPTSPYGLLTRIYDSGVASLQSQRETTTSEYFGLSLNPLGGNVGIGTTSPAYRLDVNGIARAKYFLATDTTLCTNLNADLLDGYHETNFFRSCRGGATVAFVDTTVYTAGDANYQNLESGTYQIQRSGYSDLLVNFKGTGSTSALQFYTNYSDGADLKFRKTVDSNRVSGAWVTILTNKNYSSYITKSYVQDTLAALEFGHRKEINASSVKWVRIAESSYNMAGCIAGRVHVMRAYNNQRDEQYIFDITIGYDGVVGITQTAGCYAYVGTHLIDKMRVVYKAGAVVKAYIEVHYNGTEQNTLKWATVGGFMSLDGADGSIPSGYKSKEFFTSNGINTNGSILPQTATQSIGSASNPWQYLYAWGLMDTCWIGMKGNASTDLRSGIDSTSNLFRISRRTAADAWAGWLLYGDLATGHVGLCGGHSTSYDVYVTGSLGVSGLGAFARLKSTNVCIECDNTGAAGTHGSEINNFNSHLYIQHKSNKNLMLATGGGNVGIGTTSPAYKLDVYGSTRVNGGKLVIQRSDADGNVVMNGKQPEIQFIAEAGTSQYASLIYCDHDTYKAPDSLSLVSNQPGTFLIAPNILANLSLFAKDNRFNNYLAYYNTSTPAPVGALVISFPNSWKATMATYEIDVYEYNSRGSSKIICGGYDYTDSNGYWVNTSITVIGDYTYNVRFGYYNGKCCIVLGDFNTTWSYPQVWLKSVETGFGRQTEWASNNYSITLVSDSSLVTKLNTPVIKRTSYRDDVVIFKYNPADISNNSPAADAKTHWSNELNQKITAVYNNKGVEYAMLFAKAGNYGTVLSWTYADNYLRILRNNNGTWLSTDWEKISAGYADWASCLHTKGTNTITNTTNDTTAKWGEHYTSIHWYTATGLLTDQPSQYGYILNVGSSSEVHQLWMTQSSGNMYHRGGNASGWNGTWRRIIDSVNISPTLNWINATSASAGSTLSVTVGGVASSAITISTVRSSYVANWLNTNSTLTYGASGLNYFNINGTAGTTANANVTPEAGWYHILRMNHANNAGYFFDIASPLNNVNGIYYRQVRNGANYGWYKILDSNNYTSYTVTKTGGGASGTWGISISGSANSALTATKLQTARTLWGQLFDGTANVSGNIIGAAGGVNIEFTNEINCYNGHLYLNHRGNGTGYNGQTTANILALCNGGNFGIGTASPSYKLHVASDILANGWLRTTGDTGWYSNSYGGGWYMADSTWIRTYGSKNIYMNTGYIRTDYNNSGSWWTSKDPRGKFVAFSGGTADGWSPAFSFKSFAGKYELGSLGNVLYLNYYADTRTTNGIDKVIIEASGANTPRFYGLADTATNLANAPSLSWTNATGVSAGSTLTVTAGGKTSTSITITTVRYARGLYCTALTADTNYYLIGSPTSTSGSKELRVAGGIYYKNANLYAASFWETSDRLLKKNIQLIKKRDLTRIQLKEFDYINDNKHGFGVIAQEIENIVPELVENGLDGYKKVNYTGLLILKIQLLEDEIKELKNQLNNGRANSN